MCDECPVLAYSCGVWHIEQKGLQVSSNLLRGAAGFPCLHICSEIPCNQAAGRSAFKGIYCCVAGANLTAIRIWAGPALDRIRQFVSWGFLHSVHCSRTLNAIHEIWIWILSLSFASIQDIESSFSSLYFHSNPSKIF